MTSTDQVQVTVSEKTRVADVVRFIKGSYPELPISENAILVTINNQVSQLDQVLEDNDQISSIPHMGDG